MMTMMRVCLPVRLPEPVGPGSDRPSITLSMSVGGVTVGGRWRAIVGRLGRRRRGGQGHGWRDAVQRPPRGARVEQLHGHATITITHIWERSVGRSDSQSVTVVRESLHWSAHHQCMLVADEQSDAGVH
jgi:hypothetical protein